MEMLIEFIAEYVREHEAESVVRNLFVIRSLSPTLSSGSANRPPHSRHS